MTIVCLGWGSITWDKRNLPAAEPWEADGPVLPLEFARRSKDGRITLVLTDAGTPCQVLWAPLAVATLAYAIEALREREETSRARIGSWPGGPLAGPAAAIAAWAEARGFDGVVWTALPPNWPMLGTDIPPLSKLVPYLAALTGEERRRALEYICRAPDQIATAYRPALLAAFQ